MTRAKHILMLLANPFNPDERVMKEAIALHEAGYRVTILAWDREGRFPKREKQTAYAIERIRFRSGYGPAAILTLPIFQFFLFFRALRIPADLIHCHDFDTLVAGFAVAKLRRKKIVYDAHEFYGAMVRGISRNWFVRLISRFIDSLESWLVRRVDGVITVVPFLEDRFRRSGAKLVTIVYNAKDLNPYAKTDRPVVALRERLEIPEGAFVYLYAGLFDRRRFPKLQIELFQTEPKLQDAFFILIGFPRDLTLDEIRKEIGPAKNILLLPGVPVTELKPYLTLTSAVDMIHDPADENFRISMPNKFFEAVAAGKPLVATEGMLVAKTVAEHEIGEVVRYTNRDELCHAFIRLKTDLKRTERMGKNARKLAEDVYHWGKSREALVNFYQEISAKD